MSKRTTADIPTTGYSSRNAESARETEWQNTTRPRDEQRPFVRNDPGHEPVGDRYVERESRAHYRQEHENMERGTSWTSVIMGWLTSLGAGVILAGIVGGIISAIVGLAAGPGDPAEAATEGGIAGIAGLVITLFLAFLSGGYCASRMASRSGVKHGLLVPALAVVVTIALAIVGAVIGTSFIDSLGGVTLPQLPAEVPQQSLGTIMTVTGIIALIVPFIGGALGGMWGAKTGRLRF